ncbi:major royal jelly protein 2-like [Bombus pascuorum]|uniref:major royal jelly protein 2-like n=1 Tax=Bombus pascuorum TaxID=65598 RepID=UPI00212200F0|nr:major royal jelly protein 2-like [Bombus pascuorum]
MLTPWLLVVFLGIICQGSTFWINSYNPFARNLENAMRVVYEWRYIDFDFGSEARRQAAINSGEYNYTTVNPIDVDRWRNLTFVTVIRDKGVPSSLNVISDKRGPGGPLLTPYPNWNWTSTENCSNIISVYRVSIDRCDRLWVLDTGVINDDHVCPAKLVVFDLTTSELLQQIEIPENIAINSTSGQGLLVTPAVQTFDRDCNRIYVYIADADGYGLIVYDGSSFRRLTSNAFNFDPRYTNYTIDGTSFQLQDGIVGMAISPVTANLHFSPMSSHNLDYVNTYQLMQLQGDQVQYQEAEDILWTQSSAKAVSTSGAVFFGLVSDTSIGCRNEFRPLRRENIRLVARNRQTLQFTSGLKVKDCLGREELWAMTNKYQRIATGTLDYDDVNFRILKGDVARLIRGTRCQLFDVV